MTMRHLDRREAAYDGPVPAALRAAAIALDAAEASAAADVPSTDPIRIADLRQRMAEIMAARSRAVGCCMEADLLAAGFSAAEIHAHGAGARLIALSLLQAPPARAARTWSARTRRPR